MRPLVVGQAPGPRTDPRRPLGPGGASGRFLRRLAGGSLPCEAINLLRFHPGKVGKGDAFPAASARRAAAGVKLAGRPFVLLLGRGVAAAFGVRAGYLRWSVVRGVPCAVLPHPSGINRWWNDPGNLLWAAAFLDDALRGAGLR